MGVVKSFLATTLYSDGAGHAQDDDLAHGLASFHGVQGCRDADGHAVDFGRFAGKVLLVVNVARQ